MKHRTLYSQPHVHNCCDKTEDQHIQSDYISTYQNGNFNDNERTELLSIMNEKTKKQLFDTYLKELENKLDDMDKYHHPAVPAGRRIVGDIKLGHLNQNQAIAVMHHTISLANTSADDINLQKKTDNFLRATEKINSDANCAIAMGAVFTFVTAITIACAVTAVVLTGGMLALPLALYIAFCSGTSIFTGLGAVGMFGCAHQFKSSVKDLGAFGNAMKANVQHENRHEENNQEHLPLLQRR